MADEQLPNNDRDRKLARAIGQSRAADRSLSGLDDSLIPPLLEHRERVRRSRRGDDSGKQQVWRQVAKATEPAGSETPVYRLFTSKTYRWAAAAILLIGVLAGVFYFQFWQQPELLARAGSSIEIVQLKEGSTVTLRPHSRLFAVEQSASVLLYKLKGEALFEVTPKQHRTFSVKTGNGRVSVLGTRFILSTWGKRMRVFLAEGMVKVQAPQQNNILTLEPGEAASVGPAGHIRRISNARPRAYTDWLDQQLIFNSRPAAQVVLELEQQFDITISLPANIANNRLTGQLSLESLKTSLHDLSLVLGGTFVRTGERSYRFEAK